MPISVTLRQLGMASLYPIHTFSRTGLARSRGHWSRYIPFNKNVKLSIKADTAIKKLPERNSQLYLAQHFWVPPKEGGHQSVVVG